MDKKHFSIVIFTVSLIFLSFHYTGVVSGESSKLAPLSKRGDDDTKSDGHIGGSFQNTHSAVHKSKSQVTVHEPQKSSGSEGCLNHPDVECSSLEPECLNCKFDFNCVYGKNVTVKCIQKPGVVCKGKPVGRTGQENSEFEREMVCQYCYQTPLAQQICNGAQGCNSINAPRQLHKHNCTVISSVLCLGNRRFYRMMPCNWKNGYRWSTSFILSITLGGFGADRFYLGRWQEGIGKLFSFGGLGLWTVIDIILIGVRYLGPADGSLYVD